VQLLCSRSRKSEVVLHIDGNAVSQALAVFYLPTKSKSLTFSRSNSMEKPLIVTISMNA
jgi:hypothetical protein